MKRIFSECTVRIAAERVRQGIKPKYSASDFLSREDIERAYRIAYERSIHKSQTN